MSEQELAAIAAQRGLHGEVEVECDGSFYAQVYAEE